MKTKTIKGTYQNGVFELEEPAIFKDKVEVVVVFIDPEKTQDLSANKEMKPSEFRGLWKDMQIDWTQEIKDIRNEWERDI